MPTGKSGHLAANKGQEKGSMLSLCVFKVFFPDLMVNSQVLCQSVPVCLWHDVPVQGVMFSLMCFDCHRPCIDAAFC